MGPLHDRTLSDVSNNIIRIHQATIRTPQPAPDVGSDQKAKPPGWKTPLSPVTEEACSPRKKSIRRAEDGYNSDLLLSYEPITKKQHDLPKQEQIPPNPRPMSPGSLKKQNFLRRLERQGLSHD